MGYTFLVALSPSIPTSFVPKQPVQSANRAPKAGWNIFWIVALVLFATSVVGSLGVFLYEKYLETTKEAKYQELLDAENSISEGSVQEFIRLRDRFASAVVLLNQHVVSSRFFDVLEIRTLESVRFSSLTFSLNDEKVPEVSMEGVARSFNALAAQSRAFSEEKNFKGSIFSDITVNPNNTVAFTVSFALNPELTKLSGSTTTGEPASTVEEIQEETVPLEEGTEVEEASAEEAPPEEGAGPLPSGVPETGSPPETL